MRLKAWQYLSSAITERSRLFAVPAEGAHSRVWCVGGDIGRECGSIRDTEQCELRMKRLRQMPKEKEVSR